MEYDSLKNVFSFENRFARLVNAIMENKVVPFVGAGFSMASMSRYQKDFEPKVRWLNQQLRNFICGRMESCCNFNSHAEHNILELFSEAYHTNSLSKLAEIAQYICNNTQEVLEGINIELFDTLVPTQAHRYLAYLVREGLINEVITTNYDPCLEEAYRRSFGDLCNGQCKYDLNSYECSFLGNQDSIIDCKPKCPHQDQSQCRYTRNKYCRYFSIIHNIHEYRKYGARLFTRHSYRYPIFRIYKLNGCIREYVHSTYCRANDNKNYLPNDNKRPRILLTERELQGFGKEVWAKELLRDRARNRSLLFIGFGSEEPQVRHNVLTLMEEFQGTNPAEKIDSVEEILELPNAPFMHSYGSELSFNQLQIMSGFVQAHLQWQGQQDPTLILKATFGNAFTGCDTRFFIENPDKKSKLEANEFMKYLFHAVFGRLLIRYSTRESLFYQWLSLYTANPSEWCDLLLSTLYPEETTESICNGWNTAKRKKIFGCWPKLLEPDRSGKECSYYVSIKEVMPIQDIPSSKSKEGQFGPCLLWKWLFVIIHSHPGESDTDSNSKFSSNEDDYYLALRDDSLLILIFLTLLSGLAQKEEFIVSTRIGIGLKIKFKYPGQCLYLAHEDRPILNKSTRKTPNNTENLPEGTFMRIVDLPSLTNFQRQGRCRKVCENKNSDLETLHISTYIRISASDWISKSQQPGKLKNSLDALFYRPIPHNRRAGLVIQEI